MTRDAAAKVQARSAASGDLWWKSAVHTSDRHRWFLSARDDPSSPFRDGEEVGGENLDADGRLSVRTPMQWSNDPNGGFSTAASADLCLPPVADGEYAYARVSVEAQRHDPGSLLNWTERMIRTRKECLELGWGEWRLLDAGDPAVLAHRCAWRGGALPAVHDLSGRAVTCELETGDGARAVRDVLAGGRHAPDGPLRLELEPYRYRWLRIESDGPPGQGG